jgi:hypothetical protein
MHDVNRLAVFDLAGAREHALVSKFIEIFLDAGFRHHLDHDALRAGPRSALQMVTISPEKRCAGHGAKEWQN